MPPLRPPIFSLQDEKSHYAYLTRALRMLCLGPAVWGVYIHLLQAQEVANRDARAWMIMKSTALDNYVGILWCLLGGLWSYWLTSNLVRRWFIHYEPRHAIIRLFTLATIFWFLVVSFVSFFGADEPIWPWMATCAILAVAQTIQTVHYRFRGMYRIDPLNHHTQKPNSNLRSVDPRFVILRTVLIPGGVVSFITMMMLLYQNNTRPSSAEVLASAGASAIAGLNVAKQTLTSSQFQVLIIIVSSWTPKGFQKRQDVRESALRLLPTASPKVSFTYKFVLGEPPNARVRDALGNKIKGEQEEHDDILILPVSDTYEDLSLKVFKALEWGNRFKFDFLCKTDDDIFVRWDTVAQELVHLGPTHYYWRGLAYWDMAPISNPENKNIESAFNLKVLPPFVAGCLYILSRDIVTLLTYPGPRIFTKNEDQNIGIWLHAYNIQPVHDRRIQQWDVCEDDMIAKHFSDAFSPQESMHSMYKNIVDGRALCTGFRQMNCAACYSCMGRSTHWKDWGVSCDAVKGITTLKTHSLYHGEAIVEIKDAMPSLDFALNSSSKGTNSQSEWIIPGVLNDASSIYSDTDQWARLHWAIWTTDPVKTWLPRHFQAIETLLVHNPDAVLIIISSSLPADFFSAYTRQGYQIHILEFSKELLLQRKWFFSPNTEDWLKRWDDWVEADPFFPMHLSDYLLLVALYKYGGLYMDMDALWTRAPQDRMTEFIGADLSDSPEDLSWALDDQNNYLATGLMRFQRGRAMFRHIAERYFTITTYDPSCFNCYGPKAFTQYVKSHQQVLISNGMQILPREGLYPYNWKEAEGAIKKTRPPVDPEQELVRIEERGIGLHLYGKVTSKKPIEDGSVVAEALRIWALELFETSSSPSAGSVEQRLQGPRVLYYTEMPPQRSGKPLKSSTTSSATEAGIAFLEKTPGAFQGLDAIFIRGSGKIAPAASKGLITKKASLHITIREGSVTMDPFVPLSLASFSKSPATATSKTNRGSAGARKIEMDLGDDVTMAQLNLALSRIRYLPPSTSSLSKAWGGTDEILIRVVFGELQKELVIPVVRKAGQRL